MNKKQKKQLKVDMENEAYIDENNEFVFKKLIYNPLLRALALLVLLVFSLINNNRIIKLASITSNAIFSSEHILGYVTYYSILGVTIGLCLLISLVALIAKSNIDFSSIKILRRAYQIYSIYDLIIFVLSTFVCLFFIVMILLTPCNISGTSMEKTYQDGDRVLLWNLGYAPKDGDVIVFDSANYVGDMNGDSRFYIKRIVAKEKDEVRYVQTSLTAGELYVNGVFIEHLNSYEYTTILNSLKMDYQLTFIVPKDKVFVMGDNRGIGASRDSRSFGLIDESDIIGKVLFRFYPFNKFGNPKQNCND